MFQLWNGVGPEPSLVNTVRTHGSPDELAKGRVWI